MKKQYSKTKPLCKVTFTLPQDAVKEASKVVLIGEFNDWNTDQPIALTPKRDGSYSTVLELSTGRSYEFRYLLDDTRWENDWTADAYIPSPFPGIYNSVVSLEIQKTQTKASAKKSPAKPAAAKKEVKKTQSSADKLTKIEGIGPKIAGLLKEDGIDSFAKLAKASQKKLKAVLTAAGPRYKMHKPATWPKQAALAAKGEWEKLKKLQDELQGGR